MPPYIVLDPVEIPGVGQEAGAILQDAATEAEYALQSGGAAYAMQYIPELDRLIKMQIWRSSAAVDVKLRILRQFALSTSKDLTSERVVV